MGKCVKIVGVNNIAIIPARGGSKGIPRKNIRELAGKPLIAWTIEAALAAYTVDRVIVSTDDEEIEGVASIAGAEVIRRPPAISGDQAPSEAALLHVLDHLEGSGRGGRVDALAFLQCTSPTITAPIIDGCMELLRSGYDCAFTAVPSHHFLWRFSGDSATGVNHDSASRLRRQERPPEWMEVGMCYAIKAHGFRQHEHRFFGKIGIYEVGREHAVELDSLEEWALVAQMLKQGSAT